MKYCGECGKLISNDRLGETGLCSSCRDTVFSEPGGGKIAIMVKGGLIQDIRASKGISSLITIQVYDLDEPFYEEDMKRNLEWEAITADENMIGVY